MHHSNSDTSAQTPTPFSPFSSAFSIGSDGTGTSEEAGDLGAFATVFRALNQARMSHTSQATTSHSVSPTALDLDDSLFTESDDPHALSDSQSTSSASSSDQDDEERYRRSMSLDGDHRDGARSTVWNQIPVDSYLTTSTDNLEDDTNQPTLGALDTALVFLATERARLTTRLDNAGSAAVSSDWQSGKIIEPEVDSKELLFPGRRRARQRRRRKMSRSDMYAETEEAIDGDESRTETAADISSESSDSADDLMSSPVILRLSAMTPIFRQSPKTKSKPRTKAKAKSNQNQTIGPSTPESNPLKSHLITLAGQLAVQFPAEAKILNSMKFEPNRLLAGIPAYNLSDRIEIDGFYDPRRTNIPDGRDESKLIHVFVDHSNILVGFLEWMKRQPFGPQVSSSVPTRLYRPAKPKLSHASLVLLLERGRSCARRVLVASSPLHQPVDDVAHDMGYEVSVLQRVAIKEGGSASSSSLSLPTVATTGKGSRWAGPDISRKRGSYQQNHQNGSGSGPQSSGGNNNNLTAQHSSGGGSSTESGSGKAPQKSVPIPKVPGHRRYPSAPSAFPGSPNSDLNLNPLTTSSSPSRPITMIQAASTNAIPQRQIYAKAERPSPFPLTSPATSPITSTFDSTTKPNNLPPHLQRQSYTNSDTSPPTGASTPQQTARTRFREEAVDELLQLKLLQSLLDAPAPPPRGSTIVLATGDGASSQFNPDGFVGCVRRAVSRGWRVELVGWEEGRSRAWIELAGEIAMTTANHMRGRTAGGKGGGSTVPGLYMISLERWGWDLFDSTST